MTRRLWGVAALLAVLAAWRHLPTAAATVAPPDVATVVPLAFGPWIGSDAPPLDPAVARALAADQYVHRYYGWRGGHTGDAGVRVADVEVDVAYYGRPQAGAAMHSPLACLPGNGWQVIESGTAPLAVGGGTASVRRLTVGRGADRVAMTYWFQNRGAVAGNEYAQRLALLTNGLKGRPTDAALVRVMSRDTPAGRATLDRFTRDLAARLSAAF